MLRPSLLKISISKSFTTSRRYCSRRTAQILQEKQLNERCILVDENDKFTGEASKKKCHTVQPDGSILLHRAFSVFLFNTAGQLLLQKRADEKITYPGCYTNSCCSHPIADIKGEEEEKDAIGIKRAAQRRLNFELGIPVAEMPLEKFQYLTRFHYKDNGDGKWGEHEIDYVLFLIANVSVDPNPSEISEIRFVPKHGFAEQIRTLAPLTPWFSLILNSNNLKLWWDNLDRLENFMEHNKILKL